MLGVVLGEAHPRHAVAAGVDEDGADVGQQLLLVGGPNQPLVGQAQRAQGAVETAQLALGLPGLGDVLQDVDGVVAALRTGVGCGEGAVEEDLAGGQVDRLLLALDALREFMTRFRRVVMRLTSWRRSRRT